MAGIRAILREKQSTHCRHLLQARTFVYGRETTSWTKLSVFATGTGAGAGGEGVVDGGEGGRAAVVGGGGVVGTCRHGQISQ